MVHLPSYASFPLSNICLFYSIINNLVPPPLKQFVSQCTNNTGSTKATVTGDCWSSFQHSSFGKATFPLIFDKLTHSQSYKKQAWGNLQAMGAPVVTFLWYMSIANVNLQSVLCLVILSHSVFILFISFSKMCFSDIPPPQGPQM